MNVRNAALEMFKRLKSAQERHGVNQTTLARELGVPQPRVSELETRIRSGKLTKQMELLFLEADKLGLVPVLVPEATLSTVNTTIEDYEIRQRIGSRSIYDAIYDEVADEERQDALKFG